MLQLAIPVVPTVRVVITFTKFIELQSTEQFFTPLSSPRHFGWGERGQSESSDAQHQPFSSSSSSTTTSSSSSSSAWLRRSSSQASTGSKQNHQRGPTSQQSEPFAIPNGYTWTSIIDDNKNRKLKKSKSTRRSK